LIGEYNSTGVLLRETVWMGDTPVATIRPGTPALICYVHTDHLNTPRRVARPSDNKLMWTWYSDAFGTDLPNENPAGGGTFKYNLRFPGQLYDSHAGLNQNYYRDYDSQIGKYVESDPIGLRAGTNTYSYVRSSPIRAIDPSGLGKDSYFDCLLQQTRDYEPRNCAEVLFQQARDSAYESLTRGCEVTMRGLECTASCAVKYFIGANFEDLVINAHKEAALSVLRRVARETASKAAQAGLPVVGVFSLLQDAVGTVRCTTTCVKSQ
jgi:RHS repeat-associated protein